MSCSEVSSRGYLVASDDALSAVWYRIWSWNELYLKIDLQTPQKEQKLGGKVSKKTSFGVGMELKKV